MSQFQCGSHLQFQIPPGSDKTNRSSHNTRREFQVNLQRQFRDNRKSGAFKLAVHFARVEMIHNSEFNNGRTSGKRFLYKPKIKTNQSHEKMYQTNVTKYDRKLLPVGVDENSIGILF